MTTTATKDVTISPALIRGTIALRRHEKTIKEVLDEVVPAAPEPEVSTDLVPFPAVPKTPILDKEAKAALNRLPQVFAKVLVEERRSLKPEEIKALFEEKATLKKIVAALTGREEVINENIRTHVDVDHEEKGIAVPKAKVRDGKVVVEATLRDSDGHYIFARPQQPTRVPVPDSNEEFSLEYRKGKDQVVIDGNELLALYEEGQITREEYLSMTREMRVFDLEKATKAAEKSERILQILSDISRRQVAKPGTSLFVRKVK